MALDRTVVQRSPPPPSPAPVSQKTGKGCEHQRLWRWRPLTHTHINMYRHICAFPRRDMHIQRAAVEGRQHLTGSLIIPTLLHLLIQLPLLSAQWKTGGTAAESFLRTTQPLTWEKGETASEKSRGITSQWQMSKKKKWEEFPQTQPSAF